MCAGGSSRLPRERGSEGLERRVPGRLAPGRTCEEVCAWIPDLDYTRSMTFSQVRGGLEGVWEGLGPDLDCRIAKLTTL